MVATPAVTATGHGKVKKLIDFVITFADFFAGMQIFLPFFLVYYYYRFCGFTLHRSYY